MTALAKFHHGSHHRLVSSIIDHVIETKIFYLIRGRNAWHSTWVTHYFDRCMHDTLATAKARAEELRERGSVFTIREQPALAFRSTVGAVLVTEINTQTPLASWTKDYRREKADFRLNQQICRLEPALSANKSIKSIIDAFRDPNVFPRVLPYRSNNLFLLASLNPSAVIEDRHIRLKQWQSTSAGADYFLNWSEGFTKISGKAVRRVADALDASIV